MPSNDDTIRDYCLHRGYSRPVVDGGANYLIKKWTTLAQSLANGKLFIVDEFLNEVDGRGILNELFDLMSDSEHEAIYPSIEQADALFLQHTIDAPECLWGALNEDKYGYARAINWWYYREPIQGFM